MYPAESINKALTTRSAFLEREPPTGTYPAFHYANQNQINDRELPLSQNPFICTSYVNVVKCI